MVSTKIAKIKKDLSKETKNSKAKKITLLLKDDDGGVVNPTPTPTPMAKKEKVKKEKVFDPRKANAVQVLQRIAFTHVDDRMLMNSEDIEKHETTKKFLGYDNPTTCQLNLNFLYCKAISALEKRLSVVEKQLKSLLNPNASVNSQGNVDGANVSGKKRKREVSKEDIAANTGSTDVAVTSESFQGQDESSKSVEVIDLDGNETKTN